MTDLPDPQDALRAMSAQATKAAEPDGEDLPPLTTIKIDVEGTRGKRYRGEFTFTVPKLGDLIKIGQLKTLYLPNGAAADPQAASLVEQIAYLSVTLSATSDPPAWWKPLELYDATPLSEMYGRCVAYEARFHGEGEAAGDDQETAEGRKPTPPSDGGAPVEPEVQPSAQRRETLTADS